MEEVTKTRLQEGDRGVLGSELVALEGSRVSLNVQES